MIKEAAINLYKSTRKIVSSLLRLKHTLCLIRKFDGIYGKGTYIIINPPQGMGDILACCCAKEYLKIGGKQVIVIVTKKYFADIKSFFPTDYVEIVYESRSLLEKDYRCYIYLFNKMYFPNRPYISMKYNMCLAMGLSPEVIFHNQYEKKSKFLELPSLQNNRTVLISPFATSCKDELSIEFWDILAQRLKQKGYEVFVNAPSDSYFSKHHKTCLLSLEDTVEMVSRGGYFVGWRSGLCDIIGMYSVAKIIVIYPSNPNKSSYLYIPAGISYPEAFMRSCSLKTLWNVDAVEIINNPDLLNQINNEFSNVN